MCHGDVGLITFEWRSTNRIPVANATTHQCVSWNHSDRWTKDRSVDMLKPGWLVHLTLGTRQAALFFDLPVFWNSLNRNPLAFVVVKQVLRTLMVKVIKIGAAMGGGHGH